MRAHSRGLRMTIIGAPCLALCLAGPAKALAQVGGDIDLQAFRPAMDSRGYITVNASQVLGHGELSFGLVTHWGHNLLRFESGENTYRVIDVLSPTLIAAVGLRAGLEWELGVSLPFGVMSGDRGPDYLGTAGDPNDDRDFRFDGQGIGDVGLHAKTRLLDTSHGARIGLALVGSAYLPTSTKSSWLGEGSLTPQLVLVLDRYFGQDRRLALALNGGVRVRTGDHRFTDAPAAAEPLLPATNQSIEVGTSLPVGVGVSYALVPGKFNWVGEVFGAVPLEGENYFPLEAVTGIKVYLARNSFLSLGGGAGLLPDRGANPDFRAFLGIVFEPNIGDRDGDGLEDDVDGCPDDPEDFDDFEDQDGCPELDNDLDDILDVDDACPNEPEDKDGVDDEDGCPEADRFDRDSDGIVDAEDECPDDPEDLDGFEDQDGCPDFDNDEDGILDVDDLCPDEPEDLDHFEDADGCPDPDNDHDRILDTLDQCPRVDGETAEETAEVWNTKEDDDGCPDRYVVNVEGGRLVVLEEIYFQFDSAVIKPESYPILEVIAETINLNPDIRRIEVQGHTDERGSEAYNLQLSHSRAAAVVEYLTGRARSPVAATRLSAQGYGESMPVDRRSNEQAWAKNRRVEFLILERGSD